MNLTSIVARIGAQASSVRLAGGAAQFERAVEGLTITPAAFVLPASDSADENAFMGQLVQQQVRTQFDVVLAVRNLADDEGAAATESLEPIRVAVRNALLNWTPTGATDGCEYVGGSLEAFDNGVLWWRDTYRTANTIRST